jgi:hypothetical protein
MSAFDKLKEQFKDVKVGYEGVDINLRKDPSASRLLVSVNVVGSVDLPGDTLEDMIAAGYQMVKAGNASPASGSKPPN